MIALLSFAMFSYPFSVLPILIILIYLLAWCNSNYLIKESRPHFSRSLFISLACLLLCVGCLINRYPTYSAYQSWKQCRQRFNVSFNEDQPQGYCKLFPFLNDQISFLFEYAQSLSKVGLYEKSNDVLSMAMQMSSDPMILNIYGKNCQSMKKYLLAESFFKKAYYLVPNRIYPLYLLAQLYREKGDRTMTTVTAKRLLLQRAKVPSIAENEMIREMEQLIVLNHD